MSYILEALKQSQRERDLGSVPSPTALLPAAQGARGPSRLWVFLAIGTALLAMAVALVALLQPHRLDSGPAGLAGAAGNEPKAVVEPSGGAPPPADGRDPAWRSPDAALPPRRRTPTLAPATVAEPQAEVVDEEPASDERGALETSESKQVQDNRLRETEALRRRLLDLSRRGAPEQGEVVKPPPAREDTAATPARAEAPPPFSAYPDVGALPAEVQRALPERRIQVHVYNPSPERRFVLVGTERLREGESTAEGLTVSEIRPDGVVFRFQGHLFFQPR